MDLRSALHSELMNLVRTKSENNNQQQDSMSSLDSSDADSLKLMSQLKIESESYKGKEITHNFVKNQKTNFSVSNKFTDLITPTESHVEKLETCIQDEYDAGSNHSNSQSPKLTEEEAYDLDNHSCSSIDSLNNQKSSSNSNEIPAGVDPEELAELKDTVNDDLYIPHSVQKSSSALIKRTHLKSLIYELYDLKSQESNDLPKKSANNLEVLVEGVMEKLPPGKTLKNSVLLAWKKRYIQLNSHGLLNIYEMFGNEANMHEPIETYNLMGARVTYEQNRVVSLDDCRGNCVVFRCFGDSDGSAFQRWKCAIDTQIVDRSETLWVKPNVPLCTDKSVGATFNKVTANRKVLIIDIGTASIRAGLFSNQRKFDSFNNKNHRALNDIFYSFFK